MDAAPLCFRTGEWQFRARGFSLVDSKASIVPRPSSLLGVCPPGRGPVQVGRPRGRVSCMHRLWSPVPRTGFFPFFAFSAAVLRHGESCPPLLCWLSRATGRSPYPWGRADGIGFWGGQPSLCPQSHRVWGADETMDTVPLASSLFPLPKDGFELPCPHDSWVGVCVRWLTAVSTPPSACRAYFALRRQGSPKDTCLPW